MAMAMSWVRQHRCAHPTPREDRKRSLLSAIVTRLKAAGTDPNDVMVLFGEIDRASSSFGGGRPDVRRGPGDGR